MALVPWGTGFLHVRRELCQQFEPTFAGWAAFQGTDDYSQLTPTIRTLARCPALRADYLGGAGLRGDERIVGLILGVGVDKIETHCRSLHGPLVEWADEVWRPNHLTAGPEGRRSLCPAAWRPDRGACRLRAAGVQCSVREGAIRVSPHLFNTTREMSDVAHLFDHPDRRNGG